jgi:YbbR domain-containing protein
VSRLLRIVLHNWPLKLGAIALATLLYGGLVLTERSRLFEESVPITGLNQPKDVVLLSDLGVVRQIRYFTAEDLEFRLDASSFRATVELGNVDPAAGPVSLEISVEAIDPRVQVLDFEPKRLTVQLDQVVSRTVPIHPDDIDRGVVPPGLDVRDPVLSATEVSVRGPASIVRRVDRVVGRVRIDPSGLDVNQEVELEPVDAAGAALSPVDVEPAAIRVRIAVFTDRQTRSLPVNPVVTGTPAAGWEVAAATVDPLVITVEGDADELAPLVAIDTLPVSVAGASGEVRKEVSFDLPDGVLPISADGATVSVSLRETTGTRNLEAGIALVGAQSDRTYQTSVDRVLVTLGGPIADLDRVEAATLVVTVDVTGLAPGAYDLPVAVALPTGLSLVGAAPDRVAITIGPTGPSPSPSGSPAP